MDVGEFSQIGRYGTISLMKNRENDTIVTAFGVDNEEVTFGRDPGCSVRLYYPDVNLVHCKITFEDRKAFLIVLGETGLLVDGCRVYPNATPGGQATTIPLSNNSEIEIHEKRFRFSYPPKEMRATLLATPARNRRRLRLSMIHSAQVFTPRPSKDPRENLRILKSPVKNTFRSPTKPHAPLRSLVAFTLQDEKEEEANEIVLVDGNHPRVVEEDKDLVILEDVEAPMPLPVIHALPPKTPQHRRSQSLHRAVLIRSAQRRVLEHDRQWQQEDEGEEEMEFLDTVAGEDTNSEEDICIDHHDRDEQEECSTSDKEADSNEDEIKQEDDQGQQKSLWRKSFERLWPLRNPSLKDAQAAPKGGGAEHKGSEENSEEEDREDAREEVQDQPEALSSFPQAAPIRCPEGSFMIPQARQKAGTFNRGQSIEPRARLGGGPPVRYSLGTEARRVPLDSAWRVKDLVVPLEHEALPPVIEPTSVFGTPRRSQALEKAQALPSRARSGVSVEERKAIQERRRSALREVDSHTYFAGGIPGMSPSKPSASPTKSGFNDFNNPFLPVSPTKIASVSPVKGVDRRLSTDEEDEKLDTRSLLERMKETVEGMKRRRSTIDLSVSSPPEPPLGTNLLDDAGKEDDEIAMDIDTNHEPSALLRSHQSLRAQVVEEKLCHPTSTNIISTFAEETVVDAQGQDERFQPVTQISQSEVPDRNPRTSSRSPQLNSEPTPPETPPRTRKAMVEPEQARKVPDVDVPGRNIRKPTKDQEEDLVHAATIRRIHKPTVGFEESQPTQQGRETPTALEESAHAPKRNLRKAAVKEENDSVESKTLASRRRHVPRAATTSDAEKETTKRTTTRTRSTRAALAQPDHTDADDPLNAFNETEQASGGTSLLPPRTPTRARKPRIAVKEEPTPVPSKASMKSRTFTTMTKTPATARSRARKTPATAPAATQVEIDKENAPGDRASVSSTGDADEGVLVRVRTTRKTKMLPVKQETQEVAIVTKSKTRATRTTRVRTRTS